MSSDFYQVIVRSRPNIVSPAVAVLYKDGLVAGLMDHGYQEYAVEAAISKVFASEALWRTADEALQVAGGSGYMREFPYERAVRKGLV